MTSRRATAVSRRRAVRTRPILLTRPILRRLSVVRPAGAGLEFALGSGRRRFGFAR
jgi:hypothetical protein